MSLMLEMGDTEMSDILAVVLHGGAWRSGSPIEYEFFGAIVASVFKYCAIPSYSLCVDGIKWGQQVRDLIHALNKLHIKYGKELLIIGHSCGCQLALCLFAIQKQHEIKDYYGQKIEYKVFSKIKHICCIEGIYDIPDLINEYPSYIDFIEQCFGNSEALYSHVSPSTFLTDFGENKITVVQSKDDDLLSARQSVNFAKYIKTDIRWIIGKHWQCLSSKELLCILQDLKVHLE
eukprot:NODE_45_length_27728_cov_0.328387.p10 type:complete len:233 gc:universal NODE_45_length_27728_cov_0.328387:22455-21757(-)